MLIELESREGIVNNGFCYRVMKRWGRLYFILFEEFSLLFLELNFLGGLYREFYEFCV